MSPYGDWELERRVRVGTVRQVAALVRGRRVELGLSQVEAARAAGVSRKWISDLERGRVLGAELSLVLRLFGALGLALEVRPATSEGSGEVSGEIDLDVLLEEYRNVDPLAGWPSTP